MFDLLDWKIDDCVSLAKLISTEMNEDSDLVKWKTHENHIVLQSADFFYKVYQKDVGAGAFVSIIREKLAEIYRDHYGLVWNVRTVERDGILYQIEQRQKLKVVSDKDMTFGELLANWATTLTLLEKSLRFDKIRFQLTSQDNGFYNLKLVRDCVNKYDDYGITENGQVILLDDCDWFIAPINRDGKWDSIKFGSYDVTLFGEKFLFVPNDWNPEQKYTSFVRANEFVNKWTLFKNIDHVECNDNYIKGARDVMLSNNIDVLINPQSFADKNIIVVDEESTDVDRQLLKLMSQ